MAKASKIPAGPYRSKIISIKSTTTAAGDDAIEVIYSLTRPDGQLLKMREILPLDSWAFERLCDALIAAGLNEDDDILDAIGIEEDVTLTYPNSGGLGHFSKRVPASSASPQPPKAPPKEEPEGDDFEDFLEEEEPDEPPASRPKKRNRFDEDELSLDEEE